MPTPAAVFRPTDAVRVGRGMWLPRASAENDRARLAALLGAAPAGTVLSGLTAATIHGLWVPSHDRIDVTVPATDRPSSRLAAPRRRGVVAHRRSLIDADVTAVGGLRITGIARTWCDLAADLSLPDLVAAGDSALRLGVRLEELRVTLDRLKSARGVRTARAALPLMNQRSRSRPESHLRVAVLVVGLPPPDVNVAVHDGHGQWLAEPDLSWRDARLAVEYQGADHADVRRMRRDAARHTDLQRAGWRVHYYTANTVFVHPDQIAADVRAALTVEW